jgi:hypothetical protein
MSRFYFHILDGGRVTPDEEGMELSDLLAAQAEAMASARDLAMAGTSKEKRTVQIVDASGAVVDSVPVFSH